MIIIETYTVPVQKRDALDIRVNQMARYPTKYAKRTLYRFRNGMHWESGYPNGQISDQICTRGQKHSGFLETQTCSCLLRKTNTGMNLLERCTGIFSPKIVCNR